MTQVLPLDLNYIGLHNVRLRRFMCCDLELCGPVFHCLKLSLKEQLGPQNMIDILRLLQVLTYEKCLVLGLWTNDLISFLLSEISREDEMEWMPYSIAILCNLASRSKSVCSRIKKSSSYKTFSRRIITKLLSHDSRIVVVSSLVLVGYLEEKVRDMIFCAQNIHETFQCVFNVLIMGDGECLMTRQIASDLLRRLIVSETPTVSSIPVITSTGKDVMNYSFFDRCIQQTAELLVVLDPRLEESMKVYDLLLAFCSLNQLRSPTCSSILRSPPTEIRLTTPLLAIANTAAMTFDESIEPTIPLKALRLLTHLFKEAVDASQRIMELIPLERIISIVDDTVKTSLETSNECIVYHCQRITEGLRLAEVCSLDEELRQELIGVVTAPLCSHIAEFQLMTNPIVLHIGKPPPQRTDRVPEWSIHGVAIVLELLRLLAALKDYSKLHKDQYWRSLKEERLVPFIAYAIAYGNHEMVYDALLLYTHCAQVQAFPSRWLGDLVASCAIAKRHQAEATNVAVSLNTSKESISDTAEICAARSPDQMSSLQKENSRTVDDLLQRLRGGLDIKDVKMSEMLAAYEKKISIMEMRERELELLVSAKDQALAQSEKLRIQLRSGVNNNEADMLRIRSLVGECETLKSQHDKLEIQLDVARKNFEEKTTTMREELLHVRQEREDLVAEICQERELVVSMKKHTEDLKKKLETASAALLDRQNEVQTLNADKAQLNGSLSKISAELSTEKKTHELDVSRLTADIASKTTVIEKLTRESNEFKSKCAEKEAECEEYLKELTTLRTHGQKTQADLEKMRRMREEMLKLAGGYE